MKVNLSHRRKKHLVCPLRYKNIFLLKKKKNVGENQHLQMYIYTYIFVMGRRTKILSVFLNEVADFMKLA